VAIAAPAQWAPGVEGVDVLVTAVLTTLVLTSFVFPPLVYYAYRRHVNWPLQGGSRVRRRRRFERRTVDPFFVFFTCRGRRFVWSRSATVGSDLPALDRSVPYT